MSVGDAYLQVGDPADVTNVNAGNTNAMWDMLFGGGNGYNNAMNMFSNTGDMLNTLYQQAANVNYDPNAGWGMFMGRVPEFQRLVNESLSPYGQHAGSYADLAANQARKVVEAQYGSQGARYSGSFDQAVSEAMAMPYYQAAMQEQQLKSGLFGQLAGQGMGLAEQAYGNSVNTQLQGLGLGADILGNQFAAYGNLAGNILGTGASLAQPEWWQPSYTENPGYWMNWAPQVAGMALGGVLGNPALGGAVGGLFSNLFGPKAPEPYAGPTLTSSLSDTANWWQTAHM